MRSFLAGVSLVLVSVALSAGLAELALRLTHYGDENPMHLVAFMDFDPLLGWWHKRNYMGVMAKDEFRATLQYDANGIRGLDPLYNKPQGARRVVVIGDSFVDGYTVATPERMTEVLASRLGKRFEVVNLGVGAYSTDQELLLLERQGWKYQPDLVLLAFYYNDVFFNGEKSLGPAQKPLFAMDNGNLRLTNVPVPYPVQHFRDRFKLLQLIQTILRYNPAVHKAAIRVGLLHDELPEDFPHPGWAGGSWEDFAVYQKTETPEYAKAWAITQALLQKMKKETEQHGAQFLVFYIPARIEAYPEEWRSDHLPADYDPDIVRERLSQLCKTEGISYIDPSDRFLEAARSSQLYYLHDLHWNAAGHRLAGEILAGHLQNSASLLGIGSGSN